MDFLANPIVHPILKDPERLHYNNRVTDIHADVLELDLVNFLEGKQDSSH